MQHRPTNIYRCPKYHNLILIHHDTCSGQHDTRPLRRAAVALHGKEVEDSARGPVPEASNTRAHQS